MKQEGGTRRPALVSSLDVKATPFGAYDSGIHGGGDAALV
jgi:hypothetical protein